MRRHALALALLVAFALVLLAEPIVRHATHTYTSADLTQDFALTRVGDGTLVANRGLYDPPTEMQPWLAFAREELAAGRLPLWNPYNAAGVPLHANYQSAIFSPLSVPYYLFEFKTAAILSALLRLVLLGWFTYLFVRALAFDFAPALVAATAFMLSGKSVLLLAYPHSAVAVALPAAAWCIERAVQSLERGESRKRTAAWFAGLCGAFTFGVYAGHPEPLVFVALLALAWAAWRALALARRLGWRAGAGVLGGVGAAGAVALLLGAPQILPFAEYFANSAAFGTREPTVQPSLLDWWPLLVYPSAVGAPLARMTIQNDLPAPNYEQVNTSYPGGAVLVLALIGLACLREDRRVRPFALGVLVWLVLTCDVGGLGRAWDALPWLGQTVLLSRSQTVWLFGLAVLAGLAVDRLLAARPGPLSRRAALAVLAVGGGVLAACTWKAGALLDAHIDVVDAAARSSVRARIERENLQLGLATAVAIACAAASIVVVRRRSKLALAAGLLGAIVFQNAWVAHDYNPTVEDRFVRPRTEAIEALQRVAGESAVLALTDNALPAQTNLFHRLAIPVCDDALGIRRYEELHRTVFAPFGAWRTPSTVEPEDLALFGIEHVLVAGDWVPVGTRFGDLRGPSQPVKRPLALRAGVRVEQRFVCDRAGLDTVGVFVAIARDAASEGFDLRLRLYDEVDGLFAERTWTPDEVRARPVRAKDVALAWRAFDGPQDFVGKFATLVFEARADSRGRTFTLVAEATHVDGDDAAFVWLTDRGGAPELELSVDGVKRDDALDFDYRSRGESFATEAELGGATLQRFRDGLGPFFVVSNARECLRPAEALMATTEKGFHPYRTVVLEPGDEDTRAEFAARAALVASGAPGTRSRDATDAAEPPTRVEVVSRTPTELRLRAERERPGYLVACRSWFPGWRAYVDGVERPLLIANYAFQAVRLEAGAHEIVLRYEPWSLRLGAWLAVLGLVLGTLGWRAATRTRAQ